MKPLIFAFLLTALFVPLRADDEMLKNGDFKDGNHDWYGGTAKTPADFAPQDPFAKADPFTAAGMIVPLHPDWTKECQDFRLKGDTAVIKLTYACSKDFLPSNKADDYQNITGSIGWNHWVPLKGDVNCFYILVSDIEGRYYHYQPVKPDLQSDKDQSTEMVIHGLTPGTTLTLAIAFPPGKGMMVIKSASVVGQ